MAATHGDFDGVTNLAIRNSTSELDFEKRLRELVAFEPDERLIRWYYGQTPRFIHARVVLTNHRLMVLGERGLIRLSWEPLRGWSFHLEDLGEVTFKGGRYPRLSFLGKSVRVNSASVAQEAINLARLERLKKLEGRARE